eukprot:scaffold53751_cov37-Cyclotella_meneghiniana.AAC.1
MEKADVFGCCSSTSTAAVPSDKQEECATNNNDNQFKFSRVPIGKMPQFTTQQSLQALQIDSLAFIGGSKAADDLIRGESDNNDNDNHDEHAEKFAQSVAREVESLTIGLPWESHDDDDGNEYSQITPLPNKSRVDYMKELIQDAVSTGARIMNKDGGSVIDGDESTLMIPAVLYPVTPEMKIYEEEQFGPVVPIAEYDTLESVLQYAREGKYGQQVSIFISANKTGEWDLDHECSREKKCLI